MLNYSTTSNPEILKSSIAGSIRLKTLLTWLAALFLSVNAYAGVSVNFNKVYKAVGSSYGAQTNTAAITTSIAGTNFKFEDPNQPSSFVGNYVRGILTYTDASGQVQTIYGEINRRAKTGGSGDNTTCFYMVVISNNNFVSPVYSGEAYLLIHPVNGPANISDNSNVATSSDPIASALNDMLALQPNITAQMSTATQTVCLNAAVTPLQLTATISSGTLSQVSWYKNTTNSNAGGTLIRTVSLTGTSQTISYTPTSTSAGDSYYYAIITGSSGLKATSDVSGKITVLDLPTISGVTGTLSICSGLTTTLTAASAASTPTYKWYTAATGGTLLQTGGASYTTAALTTTTSFYVDVTNAAGCVSASRTATTVTVNALPTISNVTGTLSICTNQTTTLVASSAAQSPTYKWYDAATGGNLLYTGAAYTTAALTTTTSFYVDVTSGAGCTSASRTSTTVTVVGGSAPTISSVTGTTTLCAGLTTTLTAASSTTSPTFYWYDNAAGGTPLHTGAVYTTPALNANTNFYVEVSNSGGCTSTPRTVTAITVNALPTISGVTGTLSICSGSTTTLTAASATSSPTYNWYAAATGGTSLYTGAAYTTAALTTTTSFYVEVTSSAGCVSASRTAVTVTVNDYPTISGVTGTLAICSGSTTTLTAASATSSPTYNWYAAATGGTSLYTGAAYTTAALTTTTSFYVDVTNAGGCTSVSRTAVTVTVNALPTISGVTGTLSICSGSTTTLTAASATSSPTYNWYAAATGGTSLYTGAAYTTAALTTTTSFYVDVTNAGGCTSVSRTAVTVKVNALPTISGVTGVLAVCSGLTTTLTAASATSSPAYNWYTAATGGTSLYTGAAYTTAALTTTTSYYVDVTSSGGCVSASRTQVTVAVNNKPAVSVYPATVTIKLGNAAILTADGANSYSWVPLTGLSASNTASVTANPAVTTTYTVTGTSASSGCTNTATVTVTVSAQTNPDVNATNVNVPVNGNVSTNDVVPAGSSYGTPIPASGNPSGATITMNTDGTYVFKAIQPGTYTYQVPLCAPGQTSNCPTTSLVITVKDPARSDNPPVANLDIVTALPGVTTISDILANDKCSNAGCSLNASSVTIVTAPLNGTATVNADGTMNYTPKAGFFGTDSLRYNVCDNASPANCATAWVYYTVPAADAAPLTVATDDYANTYAGVATSGNILTNDKNTGGAALSVTASGTVPASKGVLVINTDGSFTFTSAAGFSGAIDVVYTVCGGTPSTCAQATLHLLVNPPAQLNPDVNATNVNVPVSGNVSTNDVIPVGSSYGTPIPASGNPSGATITMNTDGTYVFKATQPGIYTYQVPLCVPGQTSNCATTSLVITVKDPVRTDNPPVVNLDIVTALPGETTTTNVLANDKCSNIGCSLNTASVTIVTDPLNGTATVNADGTINYTPKAGFSGTDSLRYRVCDNASPANCATAWVYYTVPVDTDPITIAADDYASTTVGAEIKGSLIANDRNTAKASLTVTAIGTVPASKGVLVINTDGTYTFTPAPGFSGPIEVAYTVCGGTPSTCAKATLYLLIEYPNVDPPKATGGTYNAGDPSNPVNIGKTVSAPPAGSKTIYCDVNGNNCSTTVPLLPTKPGIYIWCVKNIDTISNISSTPCVFDTIRILPTVTPVNATYVLGGIGLPANISGLIKTITAGSKPQWCDVNGQNCTTTAPALPNKLGVYVWCVKAVDTASGLVSTPCKFDTVTIIAPQTIMEVTKRFESIKLQPDGSFLAVFKIKTTNLMNVKMDSVQVKDDLSKVFTNASDYSVINVQATGTLAANVLYNGSGVIDLVTLQSSLAANKSDSITLSIKINASATPGNYNNVAIMQANTPYGRAQLASNDPVANGSDPNNRLATKFQVPKLDIIIPGGFSPNQDGVDDKFIITRPFGTRIALQVFNRWGNQVYQNNDYKNDWDARGSGNFLGQYVPEGTYYYVVVATDATGIVQKFAGPLTIVR